MSEDLKRIQKGNALAPVLLVRGDLGSGLPLVVADGYHRICAVCYFDESADVRCRIANIADSGVQVERDPSHQVGSARVRGQDTFSREEEAIGGDRAPQPKGIVTLRVEVRGAKSVARLAERLSEIDGVTSVQTDDANLSSD